MSGTPRCRRGVTVVEVLIALIILSIAALGSAATIGYSARQQFRARMVRQAYEALRAQAVFIDATPCAALADGHATVNDVAVSWTVQREDSRVRVTLIAPHAGATPTLNTEVWCG